MSYCDACIQVGNDINNPVKHAPEDCPHAAAIRRDRARLRISLERAKLFIPDGPGEGLVTVPGEEETGQWVIPIEALDCICPEEG